MILNEWNWMELKWIDEKLEFRPLIPRHRCPHSRCRTWNRAWIFSHAFEALPRPSPLVTVSELQSCSARHVLSQDSWSWSEVALGSAEAAEASAGCSATSRKLLDAVEIFWMMQSWPLVTLKWRNTG